MLRYVFHSNRSTQHIRMENRLEIIAHAINSVEAYSVHFRETLLWLGCQLALSLYVELVANEKKLTNAAAIDDIEIYICVRAKYVIEAYSLVSDAGNRLYYLYSFALLLLVTFPYIYSIYWLRITTNRNKTRNKKRKNWNASHTIISRIKGERFKGLLQMIFMCDVVWGSIFSHSFNVSFFFLFFFFWFFIFIFIIFWKVWNIPILSEK